MRSSLTSTIAAISVWSAPSPFAIAIVRCRAPGRIQGIERLPFRVDSDVRVFGALERVTRTVGRKVNPTVYTAAEFSKRARTENAFVTRVLEQPKLWVIGSDDDLRVAA